MTSMIRAREYQGMLRIRKPQPTMLIPNSMGLPMPSISRGQKVRATLFWMVGFALLTGGCSRVESDFRDTPVAPANADPRDRACPDLDGTYAIPAKSATGRILTGKRWKDEGFTMVRISKHEFDSGYGVTLRPSLEAFNAAAGSLGESNPEGYGKWEELNRKRLRAIKDRQSTAILDEEIAKIGPLPELRATLWGRGCTDYWLDTGPTDALNGTDFAGAGDGQPAHRYETELLLARNGEGSVLARIDRYRLRDLGIFGAVVRTSRSQFYEQLKAVDPDTFDWELDLEPEADPAEIVPRATLATDMVQISQAIRNLLPQGAELTRFQPREVDAKTFTASSKLHIDISGLAASNADVSNFMRGLDAIPGIAGMELVSLRVTEAQRIEFVLVLTADTQPTSE